MNLPQQNTIAAQDKLTISVSEMAGLLGVSIPTAYKLANQPGFPTVHIGKRLVIPMEAFKHWLNRQAMQTPA
jgi:excisionase family DNA binding protein